MRFKLTGIEWTVLWSLFLFVAAYFGPQIESRLFPVASDVVIERTEIVSATETRIWVSFEKDRDCEFIELSWYLGQRGDRFAKVRVIFEDDEDDQTVTRPPGKQIAGPWVVGLPESDLRNNSFSDTRHKCNPFWETRSRFYTGEQHERTP